MTSRRLAAAIAALLGTLPLLLAASPGLADFPDAASTGVPAGTTLTPSPGFTVTVDGTVIDGLDVVGKITVDARDVVIRRTRVRTNGATYGIVTTGAARNLLIEDVEVVGTDVGCGVGIAHSRYTARRVDVSGCVDGFRANRDTTVEDSWAHDLRTVSGGHNDALQTTGGSNIRIAGNRLEGRWQRQTSAILVKADLNAIDDVEIVGNFLSGGTYTLYVLGNWSAGFEPPTNVTVRDNVFEADSWKFGMQQIDAGAGYVYEGNVTTAEVLDPPESDASSQPSPEPSSTTEPSPDPADVEPPAPEPSLTATPDPSRAPTPGPVPRPEEPTSRLRCTDEPHVTFIDVAGDDVHATSISCASELGLTSGVTAQRFDPGAVVTRGQMASFVARLLAAAGQDLPGGCDRFRDDDGSVHENAVDKLACAGLARGVAPGRFDAASRVTRGQIASFLVAAHDAVVERPSASPTDWFVDDDRDAHEASINVARSIGIAAGVGEGRYEPAAPVRRGQLASLLVATAEAIATAPR